MSTQTTGGGSTVSFGNAPQANNDTWVFSEDAANILILNVMANDLGGAAKTLFSVDDGTSASASTKNYAPADLLVKDVTYSSDGAGIAGTSDHSWLGARIWIESDGTVHYDKGDINSQLQALAVGETLTDKFTYAIQLGNGTLSWATVSLQFTGTNDAPVAQVKTDAATEGGAVITGNVVATDVDDGAVLSYGLTEAAPAGLTFHADGSYSFDPTVGAYDHLAAGAHQDVVVHYKANDGLADSNVSTLTITVTGTNDAPVATNLSASESYTEDTPLNLTDIVVSDIDNTTTTATLTLSNTAVGSLSTATSGAVTSSYNAATGVWTASGAISDVNALLTGVTFTPAANFNGSFTIVTSVSDGLATITGTKSVTGIAVNDPPAIAAGSTTTGAITAPPASSLTPTAASYLTAGHNLINGLGGTKGFGEQDLATGDDNSSAAISITSVFGANGLNFFGHQFTSLYINNNGNITFNAANSSFTPSQITAGFGNPIIAPFWADVYTNLAGVATPGGNSTGADRVHYDLDTVNGVVTITWDDVGYYSNHNDKLDAFQLQLINEGSGNFDIVFRYENINWTTGDASGGSGGLGGTPARAGYSAGDNVHYFELPQSGTQASMLGLPNAIGNTGIAGVDVFQVRNGQVVSTNLTQSGVINFSDPDLTDVHSIQSVTYTGPGSAIGQLNLIKTADTTGVGTGGKFAWTYTVDSSTLTQALGNNSKVETFNVVISDGNGGTTSQTVSITLTPSSSAPAGGAGEPINLGLIGTASGDPPIFTVTLEHVPAGWSFSDGVQNADGSWTLHSNDLSALTVTTPASFSGAAVIEVTESWVQADGTLGSIHVSDNVEVYRPDSPIFAVAGQDYLTGTHASDTFVFSQPIGHDVVYTFNPSADRIDLIGYGLESFGQVQSHMSDDSSGSAVLDLGNGQTITFDGVHTSDLNASNFVFDATPVTSNDGEMDIGSGATLPLSGEVNNSGTIELQARGTTTLLQLIQTGITLHGGGEMVLSDDENNVITGTAPNVVLQNVDNTIAGAGQIGHGQLTLINDGIIDATGTCALVIDTGSTTIVNSGLLEATGAGGLMVNSALENSGTLWANGGKITALADVSGSGSALISGAGSIEFGANSSASITFAANATGTVSLDHSMNYSGSISGFDIGDRIHLADIIFNAGGALNYTANSTDTGGTLSITDGVNTANISLLGQYDPAGFHEAADGKNGTVITYDLHHLS